MLFAATERENTTNGKQAGDKHTKTTTTCDTRHAHLYNTQSIRVLHNLCHHHVARAVCVEQKGGKKEKKGKGGGNQKTTTTRT